MKIKFALGLFGVFFMFSPQRLLASPGKWDKGFDSFLESKMEAYRIPGAVLSIVEKDKVTYQKGFGVTNLEDREDIDPSTTIFRLNSVSKVFTAALFVKLSQDGIINLEEPLQNYIEIKNSKNFAHTPKLSDLLQHTSGLEVRWLGGVTLNAEEHLGNLLFLKQNPPEQVREAGGMVIYSNSNYTILGHVLEVKLKKSFKDILEENILKPLNLKSTSLLAPLRVSDFANPYGFDGFHYYKIPSYQVHGTSTASLYSTAADMTKFIQVLLNAYAGKEKVFFTKKSAELLLSPQTWTIPNYSGMTYGMNEKTFKGEKVTYRRGRYRGGQARLVFLPDKQTGMFIAHNGERKEFNQQLEERFLETVLDHAPPPTERILSTATFNPTGIYVNMSHSKNHIEKLELLLNPEKYMYLEMNKNGVLEIKGTPVRQLAGELWMVGKDTPLYFPTTDKSFLYYEGEAYRKIAWYEEPQVHRWLFGAIFIGLVFFLILNIKPLSKLFNRKRLPTAREACLYGASLISLAGIAWIWSLYQSGPVKDLSLTLPSQILALVWGGNFMILLLLGSLGLAVNDLKESKLKLKVRDYIGYTTLSVLALLITYWNVPGWGG